MSSSPYFTVYVKPRPDATKVLFYFTSYKVPWWIFIVPILRFRRLGYEVIVYSLHDEIMENEDTRVLPSVTQDIINDVAARRQAYVKQGIQTFHGIGNSLGSYMMFNSSQRIPFSAIVLNSVGSAADVLFSTKRRSLRKATEAYIAQNHTHDSLQNLWTEFDRPSNGHAIKSPKILITYSEKDGLVPSSGPAELMQALDAHNKKYEVKVDHLPHEASILFNALQVRRIYQFLNSDK